MANLVKMTCNSRELHIDLHIDRWIPLSSSKPAVETSGEGCGTRNERRGRRLTVETVTGQRLREPRYGCFFILV